jgi:AraC-like DNA-binding protein/mannose-6-phosphate isomerase-like protein (cupin superfamily)
MTFADIITWRKGGGNLEKLYESVKKYIDVHSVNASVIEYPIDYELPLSKRQYPLNEDFRTITYCSENAGNALFLISEPVACGVFRFEKPQSGPLHMHGYIEFCFIVSGCFRQVVEGEIITLNAGDCCFADMISLHYDLYENTSSLVLFFCMSEEFVGEMIRQMNPLSPLKIYLISVIKRDQTTRFLLLHPSGGASETAAEYTAQLFNEIIDKKKTGRNLILQGLTLRLFEIFESMYGFDYTRGFNKRDLEIYADIDRYMRDNIATVTTRELERRFHFNSNYFNLLFHRITGFTYKHYLQKLRVDRASELLSSTDMSVRDISEEVGYQNRTFFYKLFSEHTGVSPIEYRKKYDSMNNTLLKKRG